MPIIGEVASKGIDSAVPVWSVLGFIWKNLGTILGIIVILALLFIGIRDSLEQKSPEPIINEFGGRIVSSDFFIGKYFDDISQNKIEKPTYTNTKDLGFVDWSIAKWNNTGTLFKWLWSEIKLWWLFFMNIYFLGFMIYLFFKLFATLDTTSPFKNFVFALLTVSFLQIFFNIIQFFALDYIYKGIIYLVGLIVMILTIYFLYIYDRNKNSNTCLTVLLTMLIILTAVGIGVSYLTTGTIQEITSSLIPFKGTAKVFTYIPQLFMNNAETISELNYLPNTTI